MVSETSERLMGSERRPAIWPWLAMPLATLALFYGLDRLQRTHEQHTQTMSVVSSSDSEIP